MRSLSLFALLLAACSADSSDRSSAAAAEAPRGSDSAAPAPAPRDSAAGQPSAPGTASRPRVPRADSAIVRGIYVNRWAAQSPKRMRSLIALADSTEVNAFVIDIKDEFGINYASADRSEEHTSE